jgi:hypothetical protein
MKSIKKNYITIQGWMIEDLELKPNEAFTFALIFGFCQDQESEFTGSVKYICTWLNCSKNTALKAVKSLVEKELIIKKEVVINNVLFNKYSINFKKVNQICTRGSNVELGVQKLNGGSAETERGVVQKLNGGSAETEPNNTINKNSNNNKEKDSSFFVLIESKRGKSQRIDFDLFKNNFQGKEEGIIISQRRTDKTFNLEKFDNLLKQFFVEKTMLSFDSQNHFFSSLSLYIKNNSINTAQTVSKRVVRTLND